MEAHALLGPQRPLNAFSLASLQPCASYIFGAGEFAIVELHPRSQVERATVCSMFPLLLLLQLQLLLLPSAWHIEFCLSTKAA